jgi:SAM-dependent methyltransferase
LDATSPWLAVPAADYEGHMGAAGVDQFGPLRAILADVYGAVRPSRMAILGCATGNGLDVVDPAVTRHLAGVDLNAEYLALARRRYPNLAGIAEWSCAPVESCSLDAGSFDLIHAALLFEYVDPTALMVRISRWLAPGGTLSVVLQLPGGDAQISETAFSSLRALGTLMRLIPPDEMLDEATRAGLTLRSERNVPLARAKSFWAATFERP